jgi:hypothetical protein
MNTIVLHVVVALTGVARRLRGERAQTTAEYALVIVGAAAVAGLLIAWAAQSHAIGKLFDVVIGRVTKQS